MKSVDPGTLRAVVSIMRWESLQDGVNLREDYVKLTDTRASIAAVGALTFWFGQSQLTDKSVTHRIVFRAVKGRSCVEDLTGRIAIFHGALRYKVLRCYDFDSTGRYTVAECALETV